MNDQHNEREAFDDLPDADQNAVHDIALAIWNCGKDDEDKIDSLERLHYTTTEHVVNQAIDAWNAAKARTQAQPQAIDGDVVAKVHGVCSNKPRPSVQNNHSKGSEHWRRDTWHIRKSGTQTMCGIDSSEWLDMGMLETNGDTCERCLRASTRACIPQPPSRERIAEALVKAIECLHTAPIDIETHSFDPIATAESNIKYALSLLTAYEK